MPPVKRILWYRAKPHIPSNDVSKRKNAKSK